VKKHASVEGGTATTTDARAWNCYCFVLSGGKRVERKTHHAVRVLPAADRRDLGAWGEKTLRAASVTKGYVTTSTSWFWGRGRGAAQ